MDKYREEPAAFARPFKLAHQSVNIFDIDFESRTLMGITVLEIVPNDKCTFNVIRLNAKQINITSVLIDDVFEAQFAYFDPFNNVCERETESRALDVFTKQHLMAAKVCDTNLNGGELCIMLPKECDANIANGLNLKVRIDFQLVNPTSGMHFVIPPVESAKSAHMYTNCYENSTRLWLPCLDSYADPCTWLLEFTVDEHLKVVSCGELLSVKVSPVSEKKTYIYSLSTPVSAPNIAVAVGPFEMYKDARSGHKLIHYFLPDLMPAMKNSVKFLHAAFEFYEQTLCMQYPYACYKQVFVDELDTDITAYASMTIASMGLLYPKYVIDQIYISRPLMSRAVAEQFFGCFISPRRWSDTWLAKGIAEYLCGLHTRRCFGNNAYREWVQTELAHVVKYEQNYGGIILDCSQLPAPDINEKAEQQKPPHKHHFAIQSPHTVSPKYMEAMRRKAHLVIRMLEHRIGEELLFRVFNKQLSLATNAAAMDLNAGLWSQLLISTNGFVKSIYTVTGIDMSLFMDQWVRTGGHCKFTVYSVFNCKRNTIELEIRQDYVNELGIRKYNGPLMVQLQELDGTFRHPIQIEHTLSRPVITCHSKSRRNKKKKIPLWTGEEVDIDLSAMHDSPVLWIRIDPDMILLRDLVVEQPDFQWQYQLRHERDVTAQFQALQALKRYPTIATRYALEAIIENENCFYRVRCEAAQCLAKVANQMLETWNGAMPLVDIFYKLYGSNTVMGTIRPNDFSDFQMYFLQKAIPVAMASLRNSHGICPSDVVQFILELISYNENLYNAYVDSYYKAALVHALGETLTPGVQIVYEEGDLLTDALMVLQTSTLLLSDEHHFPTYKHVLPVASLRVIRKVQKLRHMPNELELFREYADYSNYIDLRLAALESLVDSLKDNGCVEDFEYLLNLLETDPDPSARYVLIQLLIDNPPFTCETPSELNQPQLLDRIWLNMNKMSKDTRLRCYFVDLYHALYVRKQPKCLDPINIASSSSSSDDEDMVEPSMWTNQTYNNQLEGVNNDNIMQWNGNQTNEDQNYNYHDNARRKKHRKNHNLMGMDGTQTNEDQSYKDDNADMEANPMWLNILHNRQLQEGNNSNFMEWNGNQIYVNQSTNNQLEEGNNSFLQWNGNQTYDNQSYNVNDANMEAPPMWTNQTNNNQLEWNANQCNVDQSNKDHEKARRKKHKKKHKRRERNLTNNENNGITAMNPPIEQQNSQYINNIEQNDQDYSMITTPMWQNLFQNNQGITAITPPTLENYGLNNFTDQGNTPINSPNEQQDSQFINNQNYSMDGTPMWPNLVQNNQSGNNTNFLELVGNQTNVDQSNKDLEKARRKKRKKKRKRRERNLKSNNEPPPILENSGFNNLTDQGITAINPPNDQGDSMDATPTWLSLVQNIAMNTLNEQQNSQNITNIEQNDQATPMWPNLVQEKNKKHKHRDRNLTGNKPPPMLKKYGFNNFPDLGITVNPPIEQQISQNLNNIEQEITAINRPNEQQDSQYMNNTKQNVEEYRKRKKKKKKKNKRKQREREELERRLAQESKAMDLNSCSNQYKPDDAQNSCNVNYGDNNEYTVDNVDNNEFTIDKEDNNEYTVDKEDNEFTVDNTSMNENDLATSGSGLLNDMNNSGKSSDAESDGEEENQVNSHDSDNPTDNGDDCSG